MTQETTVPPEVAALWDQMGNMSPQRRAEWLAAGPGKSTSPARAILQLLWMLEDYRAEIKRLRAALEKIAAADFRCTYRQAPIAMQKCAKAALEALPDHRVFEQEPTEVSNG